MLAIGFLSCAWLVAGLAAIPWAWGVSRGAGGSEGLARFLPVLALLWGAAPIALPWARRRMRRLSLVSVGLDLQREAASRRVQALGVAREIGRAAPEPPAHKPPGAGKPRL